MNAKSRMLLGAVAVPFVISGTVLARDAHRQRTENGHTRRDTWTGANGKSATATRNVAVTRDKNSDTVTRQTNYSTFDERPGAKSDVIQRTEDGYSRDTTRTRPNGATHTRAVDVTCDRDVGKCVKQVEVGKE